MLVESQRKAPKQKLTPHQERVLGYVVDRLKEKDRITHVGMMLGRRRFIHAAGSSRVRLNRLGDEPYRSQYRGVRRFFSRP